MIYLLTDVFMHVHTLLCFLIFSFSSLVNRAQDTQQSLTVAILAGCALLFFPLLQSSSSSQGECKLCSFTCDILQFVVMKLKMSIIS